MTRNKLVVGLTGGSGTGKTTVSRLAEKLGYFVINADDIGHDIILRGTPCYGQILRAFGEEYLSDSGEIDRKKLGALVFSDPGKLDMLSRITHPAIAARTEELLSSCGAQKVLLDAALLFEARMERLCDLVIAVLSPPHLRMERIAKRDGISPERARERLDRQPADEFYLERTKYILRNNGDMPALLQSAQGLLKEAEHEKL